MRATTEDTAIDGTVPNGDERAWLGCRRDEFVRLSAGLSRERTGDQEDIGVTWAASEADTLSTELRAVAPGEQRHDALMTGAAASCRDGQYPDSRLPSWT